MNINFAGDNKKALSNDLDNIVVSSNKQVTINDSTIVDPLKDVCIMFDTRLEPPAFVEARPL